MQKIGKSFVSKKSKKSGWTSKTVYLITLSGTDNVANQSTGYVTDLLSGFCLNNAYLENVVSIVNRNIPKNSNIILAAHTKSYDRTDVWGKYDVLGKKYGSAKITLNLNTKTFYKSQNWLF